MRQSHLWTPPLVSVVITLALCMPSRGDAQSMSCLPQNGWHNTSLRSYLQGLVTAAPGSPLDSVRAETQLPAGSASSVVIQKQKNLCTQAAQAYHVAIKPSGLPQVSRQVVLIKVGSNRYVVWDPAERSGEFGVYVVFDTTFTKLTIFFS